MIIKLCGLVLSFTLIISIISGCVGVNGNSSTGEQSDSKSLTLMTNDSTKPGWKAYQKKIEKATGIKINVVPTPTNPNDMVAKMTTILSSGDNSVDLLFVNDELITAFSRAGYLEPLEKNVMTKDTANNFSKQYIKDIPTFNGHIYSVPSYLEILSFWVNHEILKKTGMGVPKNEKEFLDYAKEATQGKVYGYGGSWEKSYVYNEIGTFINLFGGDYFNWKNPNTQKALKFMYNLAHKVKVTPMSQIADIYDPMMQKFIDGKYGMIFMYTGAIPTFQQAGKFGPNKLSIEPMPKFKTNDAYMASWHYVLNKSSLKKKAAIKVLKYTASKEGQIAYSEMSGRLPARLDVINDPNFNATGLDRVRKYIKNSTLRGRPLLPQSMEFINSIGGIFQKYVTNEISLNEAVNQAQKEINLLKK